MKHPTRVLFLLLLKEVDKLEKLLRELLKEFTQIRKELQKISRSLSEIAEKGGEEECRQ